MATQSHNYPEPQDVMDELEDALLPLSMSELEAFALAQGYGLKVELWAPGEQRLGVAWEHVPLDATLSDWRHAVRELGVKMREMIDAERERLLDEERSAADA